MNANVTSPGLTQLADTSSAKKLLTQSPATNRAGAVSFSQLLQQREQGQDVATAALKAVEQQDAQRNEAAKRRHEAENRANKAGLNPTNPQGFGSRASTRTAQGNAATSGYQVADTAAEEEQLRFGESLNAGTPFSRAARLNAAAMPFTDATADPTVAEHPDVEASVKGSSQRLAKANLPANANASTKPGSSVSDVIVKTTHSDLTVNKADRQASGQAEPDTKVTAEAEINLTMSAVSLKDDNVAKDSGGATYSSTPANTEPYFMQSRMDGGGWHAEMGQRIVWMCQGEHQSAVITLNPPNLGPLKIEIQAHRNVISANFVSDNAEVRQALEEGFPALKSAMADAGVVLDRAAVSAGGHAAVGGQTNVPNQLIAKRFISNQTLPKVNLDSEQPAGSLGHGLVDTFA